MKEERRIIWLENLVLFNGCVQKSGGVMNITGSFTDSEGDVEVDVSYNKLTSDEDQNYLTKRIHKIDKYREVK
jgi:hypothetical protein